MDMIIVFLVASQLQLCLNYVALTDYNAGQSCYEKVKLYYGLESIKVYPSEDGETLQLRHDGEIWFYKYWTLNEKASFYYNIKIIDKLTNEILQSEQHQVQPNAQNKIENPVVGKLGDITNICSNITIEGYINQCDGTSVKVAESVFIPVSYKTPILGRKDGAFVFKNKEDFHDCGFTEITSIYYLKYENLIIHIYENTDSKSDHYSNLINPASICDLRSKDLLMILRSSNTSLNLRAKLDPLKYTPKLAHEQDGLYLMLPFNSLESKCFQVTNKTKDQSYQMHMESDGKIYIDICKAPYFQLEVSAPKDDATFRPLVEHYPALELEYHVNDTKKVLRLKDDNKLLQSCSYVVLDLECRKGNITSQIKAHFSKYEYKLTENFTACRINPPFTSSHDLRKWSELDNGQAATTSNVAVAIILVLLAIVIIVALAVFLKFKVVKQASSRTSVVFEYKRREVKAQPLPKPVIDVNRLQMLVGHLKRKMQNETNILEEYESVILQTALIETSNPKQEALQEVNIRKNRYADILPYDFNRVKLKVASGSPPSDYINASHINFPGTPQTFIALQAPKSEMIPSLWKLVMEQNVNLIVMITGLEENNRVKATKYWPEMGETIDYGGIEVKNTMVRDFNNYMLRELVVTDRTNPEDSRSVFHLHNTRWTDKSAPDDERVLVDTIYAAESVTKDKENLSPILVHCSAGVGRTGTFIGLYKLYLELKYTQLKSLDIPGTLRQMRKQRTKMVQKRVQYVYMVKCLLMLAEQELVFMDSDKDYADYRRWKTDETN